MYKELKVIGDLCYGIEKWNNENINSFELALELMEKQHELLKDLVTHKFLLEDYKTAFNTFENKNSTQAVKIVFDLR